MTRLRFKRTLRVAIGLLVAVLLVSLAAKFAPWIPGIAGSSFESAAGSLYDYLSDMALVFVALVAVFLARVLQKRSTFIERLEEEWRGIVGAKTALVAYCERPYPSTDDYIAAFGRMSEAIDNMRIVYRNVGETRDLVGLYPYAPLHDMRRALQSIDPRRKGNVSAADRELVRDAVLQSMAALRETFLDELDLVEPAHPLLISAGRRLKSSGCAAPADLARKEQRRRRDARGVSSTAVDEFLARLSREEDSRAWSAGVAEGRTVETAATRAVERSPRAAESRDRAAV